MRKKTLNGVKNIVVRNLKQIRTEKNISLRQLADSMGVSHSQLSRIESGETSLRADFIPFLAYHLKASPKKFFADCDLLLKNKGGR